MSKDSKLRLTSEPSICIEFTHGSKVAFDGWFDKVTSLADGGITYIADFDKADSVDFSKIPWGYVIAPEGRLTRGCLAQLRHCVNAFPKGVEDGDVGRKANRDVLTDHGMLERIGNLAYATAYGARCVLANEGIYDGDKHYLDSTREHPDVHEIEELLEELVSRKIKIQESMDHKICLLDSDIRLIRHMILNRFRKLVR